MKIQFNVKHVTGTYYSDVREMNLDDAMKMTNDASQGFLTMTFYSFDEGEKIYTHFSTEVLKCSVISFRIMR